MLNQIQLPDYEYIADLIGPHDPSEIHGMLCGMLCLDDSLISNTWITQLAEEMDLSLHAHDSLRILFNATVSQINDEEFAFMLLLPDDDVNMSVRAESLGYWCQGFLTGLGLAGMSETSQLPEEVQDFLNDVSHIARIGLDGDNPDEDDEIAYSDIVEYLRMGVLLISQELPTVRTDYSSSHSLH
jgi:uncharacterized protein YgfB (UPF0149 family)